jgi:predicted transcriptional regulator of viral defense system
MASQLPEHLAELAQSQRGILTIGQVIDGGLTRDVARWRLRHGSWQRRYTGVFAVFSGEPGRAAVLWAAGLRAGPGAMLSFHTAAELATLTDRPSELIHVTVPSQRRPDRIPGVILHRSDRAAQMLHPARTPPQTRVEETVLDLVSAARTIDDAHGWVTRAVGLRLTTEARLREAMELRGRLRWRRELTEALAADAAGVHSVLEHRYLRDVERPHRLPRAVRQARARARTPDGGRTEYRDVLYEAYLVAVELDGLAAHPADRRWPDIHRDNAAATTGVITLRYGWLDVTQHPCRVAAQVAEVLRLRGYTGGRACSADCPVRVPVAPAQPHRVG